MDAIDALLTLGVAALAMGLWLAGTALTIWVERRVIAKMQSRIGPNRVGPAGILQTIADGAKLFFKEDITPRNVDRLTYLAAPGASAIVAILTFAVIPFGGTVGIGERTVTLQVWDPNIGLLWILAMSSLGVYGIVLAGWASGSKYPLLGGVRSSAQMISYELAMGLGLASVFVFVGSLEASDIVASQEGAFALGLFGGSVELIPRWHVIPMLPAFLLFFGAAIAETQRPPFDLPEAEGELVAGFHTEYTGAKFAMFFLAEFMNLLTMSAVTVTLFFGGPNGPLFGPDWLQGVLPTLYFVAKVSAFVFVFTWLRATLPRFRYDRLMDLGWRVMLPLGLVWVLASGLAVVVRQTPEQAPIFQIAAGVLGLAVLLYLLSPLFARRGESSTLPERAADEGGEESTDASAEQEVGAP